MKTWVWMLAIGGGVGYYLYRKSQQPQPLPEDVPVDELPPTAGELYTPGPMPGIPQEGEAQLIMLQRLTRKLLKVASARMPFMPPMIPPKTITRSVTDQVINDLSDQLDGCFGLREWSEFILGPFMSEAQITGVSKLSKDDQRMVYLEAFINFFEHDTQALKKFLLCMRAEHGYRPTETVPVPVDRFATIPRTVFESETDGGGFTPSPERGGGLP